MTDERDRRTKGHRDHARERTRTPVQGVPAAPDPVIADWEGLTPPTVMIDELSASFDNPTPRELAMVSALVRRFADHTKHAHQTQANRLLQAFQAMSAAPSSDRSNVRIAELETWRRNIDEWRLRLTGAADTNGRLGEMTRTIESLRDDVGTPKEAREVREAAHTVSGVRRRMTAAVIAAGFAVGGSAWGLLKSRDSSREAAARASERLKVRIENVEHLLDKLFPSLPHVNLTPDPKTTEPKSP
jgi:hypothetical protein